MSADPRYTLFAARAVFDDRLSAVDVRVLAALGTFSDRQGWCRPSQTTIAARIGSSRTWVNASIKRLVANGYVQAVKQAKESGAQAVSLYRVLIDLNVPEAVEEEAAGAEITAIMPVCPADTPPSAGQTGRHVVPPIADETQDAAVSAATDTPVSVGTDTPCLSQQTQNIPIERKKERKTRASARLDAEWIPREQEITFGVSGGLSKAEVLAAADHMRDWATANAKSKADWDLTFRNWLRTTISDAKRGRRPVVVDTFDRAQALKIYREHGYRHPQLSDDDITAATGELPLPLPRATARPS